MAAFIACVKLREGPCFDELRLVDRVMESYGLSRTASTWTSENTFATYEGSCGPPKQAFSDHISRLLAQVPEIEISVEEND